MRGIPGFFILPAFFFPYLLAAMTLTGCDRPQASGRPVRLPTTGSLIAVIGMSAFDPQWPAIRGGAERRAGMVSDLRFEYAVPRDGSPAELEKLVEEILARRPTAICLHVTDTAAARPVAERILKTDARLVTMGTPIPGISPFAHVGVNWPGGAELLGRRLDEIAAGRRSYLLLHENGRDETATHCYARFFTAAQGQSLRLLEERNAASFATPNAAPASTAAEGPPPSAQQQQILEMLRHFPNAGLVITLDSQPWLSLRPRLTLDARNRLATLGAAPPLWLRLRSGEAAALVGPLDGEIGRVAVELVLQSLTGETPRGTVRQIECELTTPATLDDFARRYAEAGRLNLADLLPPAAAPRPAALRP